MLLAWRNHKIMSDINYHKRCTFKKFRILLPNLVLDHTLYAIRIFGT
jgi:hypothetical protein